MNGFEDTSTDCAICLEPLFPDKPTINTCDRCTTGGGDEQQGEENTAPPQSPPRVLTLSCGHKWHTHCLMEQLQTAQPNSSERLLFTGCQCAKCGQICNHPDLEHLTRTTDALRDKVYQLVQEQLSLDEPQLWKKTNAIVNEDERQRATHALVQEGLRKYAFYLCAHCKEPYFGGTIDCADQFREDGFRESADERLCVACTPKSQVICHNPLEHRGQLVWKCRYCCRPATHLCYGTVHFCDDCHERNSQRVQQMQQQQQQQQQQSRQLRRGEVTPPALTPIPCLGKDCPYPKPRRQQLSNLDSQQDQMNYDVEEFHSNGPSFASEQVYGCACCASSSLRRNRQGVEEPGSANLLRNPSGEEQLRGWHHLSPRMRWVVEASELPVNAQTTTNFVSSFQPCVMEQTVDLRNTLRDVVWEGEVPNQRLTTGTGAARFEVSAKYMGRTDCPSVFCLKAVLLDETRRHVLKEWATPVLNAPPDAWEQATLLLENIPWNQNPRFLSVVVLGKDSRFWQGLYGSKVAEISLRILGSPDQLSYWMKNSTATLVERSEQRARGVLGPIRGGIARGDQWGSSVPVDARPRPNRTLLWEGILPIACFLFLAWLLSP